MPGKQLQDDLKVTKEELRRDKEVNLTMKIHKIDPTVFYLKFDTPLSA
jgi:hypothetical protein